MDTAEFSEEQLLTAAKERVARLFYITPDTLDLNFVFGEDLKASFTSDWKLNELDHLLEDIQDVADKKAMKELSSGIKVIRTVRDYCEFMVRCYQNKPNEVVRVLFNEKK